MDTAICIASGPSLTKEDVEYCKDKAKIYVVNEGYLIAPWADVLYAADGDWWQRHNGVADFKGEKWTANYRAAQKYGLSHIEVKPKYNWSLTQGILASGGNSGFQSINKAVLDGAKRVILLGFDYGYDAGTNKHWFDDEYPAPPAQSNYTQWNERLAKAVQYIPVPVLNASRKTTIKCLPRVNLRDVL